MWYIGIICRSSALSANTILRCLRKHSDAKIGFSPLESGLKNRLQTRFHFNQLDIASYHIASCVYYLLPQLTVLPVTDLSLCLIGASNLNPCRQSFVSTGIPAGPGSTFLYYSKINGYAFLF